MRIQCLILFGCMSGLFATPTELTIEKNKKVLNELLFQDNQDFIDASKGFIAPLQNAGIITDAQGRVVWDLTRFDFLNTDKPSPDSVNPSLWRQARLLYKAGLFQVADHIYQIRGADLSNMTIIEGKTGIIVVDTLISEETAKAALDLYYDNREKKPITAIIYTHSHVDHFGGVRGIINEKEISERNIKIYAPQGFTEAALDENVMVGTAMGRRSGYMYGNLLKKGPEAQVTSGLGLTTSTGTTSFIAPNYLIEKTGQKLIIDGVEFVFLFAPDSEAPSEMLFYLPDFKALCASEDASHTQHNIYSLRGAKIRDAKAWAKYLNQAIDMFGADVQVVFEQHHWPVWGNDRCIDFLEKQRDMYKYLHDQTLRLCNQGYTMVEIGEMVKLPDILAKEWYNRGYYGSVNHNTKSIYNFYLGWFDGNPSTLHILPSSESSKKYVDYMGGADAIIDKAKKDYAEGNYRWTAEVLNHVVFADPSNHKAKMLLAETLDQLGYQSENGTWRNFYLTGAMELRNGVKKKQSVVSFKGGVIAAMPSDIYFDYLSIRLDGPRAALHPVSLNFNFPDRKEKFFLQVKNGVLNYFPDKNEDEANATISMDRVVLDDIILKKLTFAEAIATKKISITGTTLALEKFFSLLDNFDPWFNIIEPVNAPR